jgi:hypothetical protein
MVCDTWIFGERGLVDMLVFTSFSPQFHLFMFFSFFFALYLEYFFFFLSSSTPFLSYSSIVKNFLLFFVFVEFLVGTAFECLNLGRDEGGGRGRSEGRRGKDRGSGRPHQKGEIQDWATSADVLSFEDSDSHASAPSIIVVMCNLPFLKTFFCHFSFSFCLLYYIHFGFLTSF